MAANWAVFDGATRSAMKTAPFLLASMHVSSDKSRVKGWLSKNGPEPAAEDYEVEWVLCKAADVRCFESRRPTRS